MLKIISTLLFISFYLIITRTYLSKKLTYYSYELVLSTTKLLIFILIIYSWVVFMGELNCDTLIRLALGFEIFLIPWVYLDILLKC